MKIRRFSAVLLTAGVVGVVGFISLNNAPQTTEDWSTIATASARPLLRANSHINSDVAWKDMSHGQRLEYMKQVVFPKMKAEFVAFDSVRFGAMDCRTCHGSNAEESKFKMPNPELWKMPKNMDGWKLVGKNNPNYMHFMMMKVKPEMAALLGETPSNPEAHLQGFGCNNCHTGD